MSDPLPLARAELVALFLESLVFGAFCVLYGISTWILMYRTDSRNRTTLNKMLFATSTLMFALCIAHLGLDSVIFITQTLVGDSFVTYRLFIVWNRTLWIIVIPILLLTSAGISGYGACYEFTTVTDPELIFQSALRPWITTFFCISLCTNVLATTLIAAKIMWSNHKSAAIYSVTLASLLGTYIANSNAQYICLDALQPLIGVVFTLIIIRVGLGYSLADSNAQAIVDSHQLQSERPHIVRTV
ncbi:hypothetical protein A0H81_05134 [Grifola frondosa]|uniref:Uncharacterized protein n=1 Tax=Grifola frondosa TaxID=5627 RepID=A0A1C7MC00_GRIFR|nr:hypothetical protein A0H81_05134 [Grifola frondosa]